MSTEAWSWIAYWASVLLTLLCKYARYLYRYYTDRKCEGRQCGRGWMKTATIEWMLGRDIEPGLRTDGKENHVTWITRFFIVWIIGGLIIRGDLSFLPEWVVSSVPKPALAGAFGSLMEYIVNPVSNALVASINTVFRKEDNR